MSEALGGGGGGGGGHRKRAVAADDVTVGGGGNSNKKKPKKGGGRAHTAGTTFEPPGVVMSRSAENCAPQISLSKDQLTVTGTKGFRMVRASHGVSNGTWYWECTVLSPETKEGHCRLGWSRRTGSLQAPVGYDKSSFAYRDIAGSKVHESLRTDNYGESWGPRDVIGFLIKIKQDGAKDSGTIDGASESGRLGVEAAAAALSASNATSAPGNAANEIRFFKNGEDQGVAFAGIAPGTYYPAVSLYMGGAVRVNMGPEFVFPPPSAFRSKPISSLKVITKEENKAQRNRIKQERAAIGLEAAPRMKGNSAGAIGGVGAGPGAAGGSSQAQAQRARSRSKSPAFFDMDANTAEPRGGTVAAAAAAGGGGVGDASSRSLGSTVERRSSPAPIFREKATVSSGSGGGGGSGGGDGGKNKTREELSKEIPRKRVGGNGGLPCRAGDGGSGGGETNASKMSERTKQVGGRESSKLNGRERSGSGGGKSFAREGAGVGGEEDRRGAERGSAYGKGDRDPSRGGRATKDGFSAMEVDSGSVAGDR